MIPERGSGVQGKRSPAFMDIDWTKIRETVKRIERELSKADERASRADADVVRDWPLVRREDLEAAFPDWRRDFGPDWRRDFLGKRIGRENYRFVRGTREYRIAPDVFRGLGLSGVRDADASSGASATAAPEDV